MQLASAHRYHQVKTQKFDVLGNVRRRKKFVSVLIKTHPKKVINTKFILSESVT